MRRREFLSALAGASALSIAAHAQQDGFMARVGVIGSRREGPAMGPAYAGFTDELRKLGFHYGVSASVLAAAYGAAFFHCGSRACRTWLSCRYQSRHTNFHAFIFLGYADLLRGVSMLFGR